MNKLWKFVEYGYLVIAVVLLVETVLNWNINREGAYMFLVFAIAAVFMYFFKKRFRTKFENRNKQ